MQKSSNKKQKSLLRRQDIELRSVLLLWLLLLLDDVRER
jgi:hypothetical protein